MKSRLLWILILGIGIGMIISSWVSILTQPKISEDFIRKEARKLGMIDPKEYFDKSSSDADESTK